ncbi:hypothetical protein D3C76_1435860 [compost metagenome]
MVVAARVLQRRRLSQARRREAPLVQERQPYSLVEGIMYPLADRPDRQEGLPVPPAPGPILQPPMHRLLLLFQVKHR